MKYQTIVFLSVLVCGVVGDVFLTGADSEYDDDGFLIEDDDYVTLRHLEDADMADMAEHDELHETDVEKADIGSHVSAKEGVEEEDSAEGRELHKKKGLLGGLLGKKHGKEMPIMYQQQPIMIQRPVIMQQVPQVVQRVEVRRIIKEKSCPVGMDLMGDQCVGTELIPAGVVCPPSTMMADGMCIATAHAMVECPPGFQMRGGRCGTCDLIPAEFTCRDPTAQLDGSGMGCSIVMEAAPICPPGFNMMQGQCIQRVASQLQCPEGFSLSRNRQCVRSSVFPASIVCPEGATLNLETQKCVVVKQAPPRCPHRFSFNADTQSCTQEVGEIIAPCLPGYQRVGGACHRSDAYPAEVYCPDDYIMDGSGACVKEVPVPPQCPSGFQHSSNGDGMCERIVKEIPVCPQGTSTLGAGRCQSVMEHDIIQCCPPGFEMNGDRCHRIEQLVATLSCQNECYTVRTTKVAFACAEDSEFMDDPVAPKCIRRTTTSQCDAPSNYAPSSCQPQPSSYGKADLRALKEAPVFQDCSPPAPVCRDVTQSEVSVAQPYCPEGGEVNNNQCVIRDPIIPEKICKFGVLDTSTGQCVRETFVPIKTECPAGTIRQNMKCVTMEMHAPNFICPDDAMPGPNGCCIVSVPASLPPPRVIRAQPAARCSRGQLGPDGQCVEVERIPQDTMCPPEALDMGVRQSSGRSGRFASRCVLTAELIVPPPVEKCVRPSFVCPDGGRARNGSCNNIESAEPSAFCPPDTIPDGSSCVREAQAVIPPPRIISSIAVPICPPGTQVRGTTCVVTRETEALVSCPMGFDLNGDRCVKSCPAQQVCPVGTMQSPEGCMRQTFTPAMIKIVQGCVHDVAATCSGCPNEVNSVCHH